MRRFLCRQLSIEDFSEVHALEQEIVEGIANNERENIYQPFDEKGLGKALATGWAVGLYDVAQTGDPCVVSKGEFSPNPSGLAAFLYVIPYPELHHNVLADVAAEVGLCLRDLDPTDGEADLAEISNVMIADCILVGKAYRGFGLQRALFYLAECMAEQRGILRLCGTASPKNPHSIRNFEAAGYRCVAVKPKYRSERCFFVKDVEVG